MVITRKILSLAIVLITGVIIVWWLSSSGNKSAIKAIDTRQVSQDGVTIIAFGDSLTAGYGLPVGESYPAQLEKMLGARGWSVRVINAGVSGETTRGNLERAEFIRSQNPDIVLLGIGGNDALRALPLPETKKNIAQTIETLRSGGDPPVVILLTMQAPLTAGLSYKKDFDNLYAELAGTYNLPLAPFITAEVFLDASKKLPDGIHLNKDGYEIVSQQYILPVVEEVLRRFSD